MPRHKLVNGVRVDFTADEEAAADAAEAAWTAASGTRALSNLRFERDQRLKSTDVYGLSDRTMSAAMTTYRQQLRDLPTNYTTSDSSALSEDLSNLVWPTKP